MGDIVAFSTTTGESNHSVIDIRRIDAGRVRRKLETGMVLPATDEVSIQIANEHAAEPIKRTEDIERISKYLIENHRYRDNMLFIVGINFGLRVSDLLQLRYCMILDDDLTFKDSFPILEKKTRNTRNVKKNRYITINDAVIDAVTLYLQQVSIQGETCRMDDYLFRSESNRGSNVNRPMTRMSVDRILKGIAKELGLSVKMSTHSLRKTFGYHQMLMSGNDPRKLLLLQKMFGHSTSAQTLDYIGITPEEISDAYTSLNLGGSNCYDKFGVLNEAVI